MTVPVSAIVVTRGNVELGEILDSLPEEWEWVVWDNGQRECKIYPGEHGGRVRTVTVGDVSVFGRYAAIPHTTGSVVYVQDDDVVVDSPTKVVDMWLVGAWARRDYVTCNMPQEFRHGFYHDHALVGFGAAFHRDAPARAFKRFAKWQALHSDVSEQVGPEADRRFYDTCDIVFTGLTTKMLVDVPKRNLPWATDPGRMYRQPQHQPDRSKMLEWVKQAANHGS